MLSRADWDDVQRRFLGRITSQADLDRGTLVVIPSLSFAAAELAKITAIQFYEERLLCLTLLLGDPAVRMVYATSVPVDPAIVDYHLGLLPDPEDARRRLILVSPDDPAPRPLSAKLLDRPDLIEEIRACAGSYLLPFYVTDFELTLARTVGLPMYAAPPELAWLGSKTGSRRVAQRAGVAVLDGAEDLWTLDAMAQEAARLTGAGAAGVVLKL